MANFGDANGHLNNQISDCLDKITLRQGARKKTEDDCT